MPALWIAARHINHKGERIEFDKHKYLFAIYADNAQKMVIKKSTQCGITEYLICDTLGRTYLHGKNIFYVLPTIDLRNRFEKNRVDKVLIMSEFYRNIIGQGAKDAAKNVSLKQIGKGSIAFVGSNAPSAFTEYPADVVVVDELDQCNFDNVVMAVERLSASEERIEKYVSNPTVSGYGIDAKYENSDKKEWHIKCSCGHYVKPDFFRHVVMQLEENKYIIRDKYYDRKSNKDIRLICDRCNKAFDRFGEGEWVITNASDISGYHISKLFSTSITIREIVARFEEGLSNPTVLQRFYNADLGLAYTASGSSITTNDILACIEDGLHLVNECKEACVMGIDVGAYLHVRINKIMNDGSVVAVYIGKVQNFDDVMDLARKYKIIMCVVDALPETRLAKRIVANIPNSLMVYYTSNKAGGRKIINRKMKTIIVDRTEILDAIREMIIMRRITLTEEFKFNQEYISHMTASIRIYNEDKDKYEWREGGKPDHFFHAEAYAEIARMVINEYVRRLR